MTIKHKRFRVTATVTFAVPVSATQARHALAKIGEKQGLWINPFGSEPDAILRGPFKATPFPKRIKRK